MNILGISGGVKAGNQDGAAALLVDGRLVAAAEEERFVGVKFANGLLPNQAIRYCLREANLAIQDVDRVVFAGATYHDFRRLLTRYFRFQFGHAPPVELVDHHTAHAASTYYASGWDNALVVTMDNSGDGKSTTVWKATGGEMRPLAEILRPDSLGLFYSAVTQLLGFRKDSDEYKVMGMAAYGQPRFDLSHVLEITRVGYRFHHDFIQGVRSGEPSPSKQEPLFDEFPLPVASRVPQAPFEQVHYDVAASAQAQLERAVLQLVQHYLAESGLERVCFAGGVALNCLTNQKVRRMVGAGRLYVPPVCSDAGLALGAAYLVARQGGDRPAPLPHAYWGPQCSNDAIRQSLDLCGAAYTQTDHPAQAAVERIARGRVVGWFQGRLEYGPRALGSRSILADPRRPGVKDMINQKVKFREEFRPVAPAVLHESGSDYFADYCDSPYMTQTFTAHDSTRDTIPDLVHADGTSRLQSVHAATHPRFHELLCRCRDELGVPMVLNTSLNAFNDPMACEPFQALRTYFVTGMDSLVIGDFVLDKKR